MISVVFGWSIASLLGYQSYLIAKNQTTHEHRRRLFKVNPFYMSITKNCLAFWKMDKESVKMRAVNSV